MAASGRLAGRNLALLLVLGALWGTAFMFITLGLRSFSPLLFAALRFDVAGLVVLGMALIRRGELWPRTRAQWLAIGVAASLNVGGYHAFLFWGQQFTTEVVASVIVGLNPILTTVISRWILPDERVGWAGGLGLALGLGGILLLAGLKGGDALDARGLGELAIVAAILSWALGSTLVRRARHGMDVFAFTSWQMLAGAVLLHAGAFAFEGGGSASWSQESVTSLVYLAVASSGAGFLLYFTLLERVGPIRSNLVSHVAPVFAALAGWLVLGDSLELRAVLAFAAIVGGFALIAREGSSGRNPRSS